MKLYICDSDHDVQPTLSRFTHRHAKIRGPSTTQSKAWRFQEDFRQFDSKFAGAHSAQTFFQNMLWYAFISYLGSGAVLQRGLRQSPSRGPSGAGIPGRWCVVGFGAEPGKQSLHSGAYGPSFYSNLQVRGRTRTALRGSGDDLHVLPLVLGRGQKGIQATCMSSIMCVCVFKAPRTRHPGPRCV